MNLVARYKRLPKATRFALHYLTWPVWFPAMAVIIAVPIALISLFALALVLWRDFK